MPEIAAQPAYGSSFEDLAAFLKRPEPGGYPVHEVRECVCRTCGGRRFEVQVMDTESAARRTCLDCGRHEFVADSEDYWDDDAEIKYYCGCPCGEEEFAAAVGYSLHDNGDVRGSSKLVHGGSTTLKTLLKEIGKLSTLPDAIANGEMPAHGVERLRDLVRRAILARTCLASGDAPLWRLNLDRDDHVDAALAHDTDRAKWRDARRRTLASFDALGSVERAGAA